MSFPNAVIEEGKAITLRLAQQRMRIEDALNQHDAIANHAELSPIARTEQALTFNDRVVTPLYNRMEQLQHERMAFYVKTQHLPACGYL